jgi:hypothetical protein
MTKIPPNNEEATLLVPMHLDALVVNDYVLKQGFSYNRWTMNYEEMNRFENPMPDEFVGEHVSPPPAGVHLHWSLPAGLTHGVENKTGEIEFPFVPNRWLVVRIQSSPEDRRLSPAAWIVLSDAYGKDCTSYYIDPHAPRSENEGETIIPTRLGKNVPLVDWQPKPEEEKEPFLTAIAPGNVTFAAFEPGVKNVFAFHDDLSAVEDTGLTYLVVGWYSQPEKMDPLCRLSPGDWKCKFLFNVHDKFQKDLNQGVIPEVLRLVFKDNKIDLSQSAKVTRDQTGNAWRIQDKDAEYTAKLENGGIYVYESTFLVVDNLGWAVKLEGKRPPTHTLVHGMIYDVEWKREGELRKSNIPMGDEVRIAVGNTSIDALTALIIQQSKDADVEGKIQADHLDAFQYDLLSTLDTLGSKILLDQQIRQNWFDSEPGGILWEIVAKEKVDVENDTEQPEITSVHERKLAELNQIQRKLDAERRILNSMQWELYALWWKSLRIPLEPPIRYGGQAANLNAPPPPEPKPPIDEAKPAAESDSAAKPGCSLALFQSLLQLLGSLFGKKDSTQEIAKEPDDPRNKPVPLPQSLVSHLDKSISWSLARQVEDKKNNIDLLAKTIPSDTGSKKDIEAWAVEHLGIDPKKLVLNPSRMPRFWRPTDPVVLISGLKRSTEEGREGTLLCRLAAQIIDRITMPEHGATILADDYTNLIPSLPTKPLPYGVSLLLKEAFLLDVGNVEIIATKHSSPLFTREEIEKAIENLKHSPPDGISTIGRYGALRWKQPWSPLFIDWQVSYYHTIRKDSAGPFGFSGEWWKFDGTENRYAGPDKPDRDYRRSYSGRTFLTPHAPLNFVERLKKYLQSRPSTELRADEAFLQRIANWDILSQTLSGFSDMLILRDLDYTVAPYGPLKNLMDEQHQGIPFMKIVPDPGKGGPYFFPLRAGFLELKELSVVDKFGRRLDLLSQANDNTGGYHQNFMPIRGRGMISNKVSDGQMIHLSPRVVQSSRLLFRFISAAYDPQNKNLNIDDNPVCGWLLPNHIDKSISVYQADGTLLGELLLITKSKTEAETCWQPAPGTPHASLVVCSSGEVKIDNPHLKQMIEALIHRKDQGVAFHHLLEVIDKSLWTIDPLGPRDDENVSVLIGRPLALVRANVQLELCGKPFYDQAWVETIDGRTSRLKENHGGLLDLDFPVRLGNQELHSDGLIGYFQGPSDMETDYAHFHVVHSKSDFHENPPYISQIGDDDDYLRLKFKPTAQDPDNPDGSVFLTMLIDPRAKIHANCGLLPTKIIALPDRYAGKAMEKMTITFRTGPLLLEPEMVRLPLAAQQHGTWTWIQLKDKEDGDWQTSPIEKADAAAHFSGTSPNLVEGWLQFSPREVEKQKENLDDKPS